ncbi:MAG: hypothetical protein CSA66_03100 [Proteobacteria bacterium]|nr:MAG: hypothetical protein CSA66_03100 [Pseudomonadota bacterium]
MTCCLTRLALGLAVALSLSGCGDAPLAADADAGDAPPFDRSDLSDAAVSAPDAEVEDASVSSDTAGALPDTLPVVDLAEVSPDSDATPPSTAPLGGDRPAAVYLPPGYEPATPRPLIFLLHGFSATGQLQDGYLGFHDAATAAGFIAVVPEGTRNPAGVQFWNADPAWCCNHFGSDVDDVAYLLSLVDEAKARFAVEPDRVYLLGHSNGGFMSYRMACEHADVFAGIVSIAGSTVQDPADCQPSAPLTVLQVHGTLDAVIAYLGVPSQYPGARTVVDRWVAHDGCDPEPLVSRGHDYDGLVLGDETTRYVWDGCDGGALVGLWSMRGSGHVPIFRAAFLPAVFDFLRSH